MNPLWRTCDLPAIFCELPGEPVGTAGGQEARKTTAPRIERFAVLFGGPEADYPALPEVSRRTVTRSRRSGNPQATERVRARGGGAEGGAAGAAWW